MVEAEFDAAAGNQKYVAGILVEAEKPEDEAEIVMSADDY